MITTANITTARRLLDQWPAVNAARIAKDRKPYLAWLREAKPLAGFDVTERPVGGLVHKILAERVAMFDQEQRASSTPTTLPDLPATITIHLPPYARKRATEFLAADVEALTRAHKSTFRDTIRVLREHGAELRLKAKKQAAWVMDDAVVRLLDIAAHLDEAADLIDLHVSPDEDNG